MSELERSLNRWRENMGLISADQKNILITHLINRIDELEAEKAKHQRNCQRTK